MAIKVKTTYTKSNSVTQSALEAGTYQARVAQIIDLGLQKQPAWQGKEKAPAYEVMFTYELLDEFMLDENGNEDESKPRWVSERFPLHPMTSDLAKSTKRYKALDPQNKYDGDFSLLTETPCMVTVVTVVSKKNGNTYNNVANVSLMRSKDAQKAPALKNDARVFSLDEPDIEVFKGLPQWIQDLIKSNLEYNGSLLQKKLEGVSEVEEQPEVKDENAPF